ncbi:MAG: Uma2 family endonuclease [Verrucomicrobiota bacterium]
MNWQEVCDDPSLQDLPYKVELNRHGQIVMSPASNEHGRLQTRMAARLLQIMDGGEVITECSINTEDGTKVADVSWGSTEFFTTHGLVTPLPVAPQLCVEIVSPSNSKEELEGKVALYLEAGAEEVWICNNQGSIEFRSGTGELKSSLVAPEFPAEV